MLCFDCKIGADSFQFHCSDYPFFVLYVNVVAICRGKIFIINPRFRVMPHAYEIYIEKETETSFRDFYTHTFHVSTYIHTTCYASTILFITFFTSSPPFSSSALECRCVGVCSIWERESVSQKMWIKLFFRSTHR